jgi:Mor family transcriptional regulator
MPRSRRLKLFEFIGDLVGAGEEVLMQDLGLTADRAREVMLEVAKAVCFRNAKSTVYIPEAANLANLERNARIWADYQVDNPEPPFTRKYTPARAIELAARHDLSPQQVYNIIRGEREQEISERQDELPGVEDMS